MDEILNGAQFPTSTHRQLVIRGGKLDAIYFLLCHGAVPAFFQCDAGANSVVFGRKICATTTTAVVCGIRIVRAFLLMMLRGL